MKYLYVSKALSMLIVTIVLSNQVIAAEKIDVLTTISVGPSNIHLDIFETFSTASGTFGGDTRDISVNPSMPSVEVGVTVLDKKIYYGFSMLLTGQNVTNYNLSFFDKKNNAITDTSTQVVNSRSSYSFYSGYSFLDNINLYAGLSFASASYGDKVFIDDVGPYAGASYAWRFSVSSSMNFDFSYALVNSETDITNTDFVDNQYTITATNSTLSYSATWLRALDRGRSFFVRFKIIDLNLAGSTDIVSKTPKPVTNIGSVTIKGSQVLTQLSLGMGF